MRWPLPDAVGTNPVQLPPAKTTSAHPMGHHPGLTTVPLSAGLAPVLPLHNLPPPPLPRNFRPLPPNTIPPPDLTRTDEDLNPEVPAFIPHTTEKHVEIDQDSSSKPIDDSSKIESKKQAAVSGDSKGKTKEEDKKTITTEGIPPYM